MRRKNGKKLATVADTPMQTIQPAEPITPLQMLSSAVEKGMDISVIKELMVLKREWEADEARKSYVAAMAAFKANPPQIFKDRHVSYENNNGSVTQYDHAGLASVANAVSEAMAPHGLSFRWDTLQLDGGMIRVTCVITHDQGHSQETPLQSGADQSGGKNNIQAIGSTVSYLQRYTLLAAAGLATSDMDDDGQTSEEPAGEITMPESTDYINDAELSFLVDIADSIESDFNIKNIQRDLCMRLNIDSFHVIPADGYNKVKNILTTKREQLQNGK